MCTVCVISTANLQLHHANVSLVAAQSTCYRGSMAEVETKTGNQYGLIELLKNWFDPNSNKQKFPVKLLTFLFTDFVKTESGPCVLFYTPAFYKPHTWISADHRKVDSTDHQSFLLLLLLLSVTVCNISEPYLYKKFCHKHLTAKKTILLLPDSVPCVLSWTA